MGIEFNDFGGGNNEPQTQSQAIDRFVNDDSNQQLVEQYFGKESAGESLPSEPPEDAGQLPAENEPSYNRDPATGRFAPTADPNTPQTPVGPEAGEGQALTIESLAEQYGIDPKELEGYTTVDEAAEALVEYDRQLADFGRRNWLNQQPGQLPAGAQPPQQFQQPQSQPGRPTIPQIDLDSLPEDEPTTQVLRALMERTQQQEQYIQQLAARSQAVEQAAVESRQRELIQHINTAFDGFEVSRYGKTENLNQMQVMNRIRVAEEIDGLRIAYMQQGRPVPPIEELLDRADRSLHFKSRLKEETLNQARKAQQQGGRLVGAPATPSSPGSGTLLSEAVAHKGDVWDNPALINLYQQLAAQ